MANWRVSGRRSISWLIVVPLGLSSACVAPHHYEDNPEEFAPTPQAGTKPTAKSATPVVTEPSGPSGDEQMVFIRRQLPANAAFTDTDRQLVTQLPTSPQPGSVAEAALALGLIKTVLHPLNGTPSTFQESDLKQPGPPVAGQNKLLSLEQLCRDHGLNLPDAISENPLLGSAAVAQQTMAALNLGDNSKEFSTEITLALKKRASEWNDIAAGAPATVPGPPPLGQFVGPPAPSATTATGEVPMLVPLAAAPAGGDNALVEAQALADRGDFRAAVQRAASIPETSALYIQAKEKIKEFSNLGVQDLRRKAAAAFQTAMPVGDPKTRAEYLKQAKAYLEDALTSFPAASQLPTVRENLRVITKDLDKLSS